MQTQRYRIRNWSHYNRALIQRGSITLWIDENAIKGWLSVSATGKAGRPETYSNDAILMLLILRERFGLPLRALVGFALSLFQLMGLTLPLPCYTQICRRAQNLHNQLTRLPTKGAKHVIFDSTGLKVHGEGEWKVRTHGKGKRRTWRKFHVAINADTQEIISFEVTGSSGGDAKAATRMISKMSGIESIRGDGAYDKAELRQIAHRKGTRVIVPPPKNATYKGALDGWERERDASLAEIEGLGGGSEGRRLWKKLVGYHRRSLIETTMYRIKTMLGASLKARGLEAQRTEAYCKCLIINKMNELGLPVGEWVLEVA